MSRTKIDGMWDLVSKRFAAQISGDVMALISPSRDLGIFELSEIDLLLSNPAVTTIEGIEGAVLVEMAEQPGGRSKVVKARPPRHLRGSRSVA